MPSEATLQRQVIKWLREQGAYVYKAVGHPMAQRGTPDLLMCWRGQFYGIELKVPGKTPSKLQELQLQKIVEAGGHAVAADNLADLKEVME